MLGAFGSLTDEQWRHVAKHSFFQEPNGGWRPHYDPGIGDAFRPGRVYSVSMWRDWDAITCPVLLLRGAHSELLLASTADEMTRRGPPTRRVEISIAAMRPRCSTTTSCESSPTGWARRRDLRADLWRRALN
ncbi:alpha/beta fold hydrolase [Methylobacterium oryzae CBMB20]